MKLKVIPNYIQIRINTNSVSARRTIRFASQFWLKSEVKQLYIKRNTIKLYIKVLHTELSSKLHPIEWDIFDDEVRANTSEFVFQKRNNQEKKILNLLSKQPSTIDDPHVSSHKFHERLCNLSSAQFSAEQSKLLNKGLKYNPPKSISPRDLEAIAIDASVGTRTDDDNFKNILAARLFKFNIQRSKQTVPNDEYKVLKKIKSMSKEENLTIVKADKGNTIVILDKADYVSKVNDFLDSQNLSILNRDPTSNFNAIVKSFVKSSKMTCSEKDLFHLINMNPQPPKLYGLPKIHKDSIPIRPVVAYRTAPAHKLAYKYNTIFRQHSNFKPSRSVINSLDLVNKIKNLKPPTNALLVSFDVSNLFTNVPVSKALQTASDLLFQNHTHPTIINEIIEALTICSSQNYFEFNNKLYRQHSGLAMGSPLSPLLAEIFMDQFENILFNSENPLINNIFYWYRYVDDIICCWLGTQRQLSLFLNFLNSIEPSINFTLEIENNKSLNFLDLTISINNSIHEFSIYRKPSQTDTIIPFNSSHAWSHKLAFFHCMIHRLLSIPLSHDHFQKELNTIKQIAINNNYPPSIIDKLLHKKRLHLLTPDLLYSPIEQDQPKKYFKLPFFPTISNQIKNLIPQQKYKVSFYTPTNLGKLLVNCKTPVSSLSKSGVYQLSCQDCDIKYIGKTGRSFNTRIKEHQAHWKNKTLNKSNFADHLINNNHNFDPSHNIKFLYFEHNSVKLTHLEIAAINRNKVNLCNEQTSFSANSSLLKIKFH